MKDFADEALTARVGSNRETVNARSLFFLLLLLLTIVSSPRAVQAQAPPMVGSQQPAQADPSLSVPPTTPIKVPLFTGLQFTNFDIPTFNFTPAQHGPWAKIVFVADFNCTAGRQFDRTAMVFLGNTNIYYGTTQEPQHNVSPSWHVERDLTDYAPLFASPQTGDVVFGNVVDSTFTGIYTGSAYLLFYPAVRGLPAVQTPADLVIPLNNTGNATLLPDPNTPLAATITFPQNVVRAYLDVVMQSQIGDEFWYFGVPNNLTGELEFGGGTGFREGEISIDGTPAGVAPVYPWIYTGGIDPFWWRPIPGVQAYNFAPYRVDLTPFAAMLDDGNPHTVAINVFNDSNYFNVTGTLLVYTDPFKKHVTGAVTVNTVGTPNPVVTTNLMTSSTGEVTGPVQVSSNRQFTVEGFVNTSLGRIDTRIDENIAFSNLQNFDISSTLDEQNLIQDETFEVRTTTRQGFLAVSQDKHYDWPLKINFSFVANADGSADQIASADQADRINEFDSLDGFPIFASKLSNEVTPSDTIVFPSTGDDFPQGPQNTQTYTYSDTLGDRWSRQITAANLAVTGDTDGNNFLPNWWLPGDFAVPVN
jgi:hypothetical protein